MTADNSARAAPLGDIVNGLVFDGKRTVKSSHLRSLKVRSQYKADKGNLHEEERDNAKYLTEGRVNKGNGQYPRGIRRICE